VPIGNAKLVYNEFTKRAGVLSLIDKVRTYFMIS